MVSSKYTKFVRLSISAKAELLLEKAQPVA